MSHATQDFSNFAFETLSWSSFSSEWSAAPSMDLLKSSTLSSDAGSSRTTATATRKRTEAPCRLSSAR